jgi:Fe-S oxidoreductase
VLWPDTFNNYFFPETAQAAVAVLEQAGFEPVVPRQHVCCGRPLYDYGMLGRAKQYLTATLDAFEDEIRDGTPFVFLEPSCASVFRDELKGLLPHDERGQKLSQQSFLLSELLDQHADGYQPPHLKQHALVHGHCHHKALMKTDAERSLLRKTGLDFHVLDSGCCGMAGSFGFESDKYDVSVAIGERVLLPAVREASPNTLLIANGFSCREQIAQQTSRQALHLAEVLHLAGHPEHMGQDGVALEQPIVQQRQKVRRRARWTAAALLGATAGAALFLRARS